MSLPAGDGASGMRSADDGAFGSRVDGSLVCHECRYYGDEANSFAAPK